MYMEAIFQKRLQKAKECNKKRRIEYTLEWQKTTKYLDEQSNKSLRESKTQLIWNV
jgi:hypothetical protein